MSCYSFLLVFAFVLATLAKWLEGICTTHWSQQVTGCGRDIHTLQVLTSVII